MKVYYCDRFSIPLSETHRFPLAKYRLIRERIQADGLIAHEDLIESASATDTQILRIHSTDYFDRLTTGRLTEAEVREIGFPWSLDLVERSRRSCGGTISAAKWALADGVAMNLAGGTHHAQRDRGAGYCVLNDVAIASRELQACGLANQIVVIDLDVHQGDGTAAIFADDPSVFTFSVHGSKNYPMRKPPSDLDIGLDDGVSDEVYLDAVEQGVSEAIERSLADFAFYIAGSDPYEGDKLGRLKVTKHGLMLRDRFVLESCRTAGLPVAIVMGGGYAADIEDTVAIYRQTIVTALGIDSGRDLADGRPSDQPE